ncbi:MBL fold metallo-hydrolase [Psychroserpens ponticola]|uniref:MBL fold metallo-hydrolase n=1 Tax=Psychroserpens ponticola TaxID=2932268 RepID=A0ABY7S1R8_9FLAO|nr:MBL fold metallo-hydrolase [Psychroserpens ponticola]WCO03326.1 MBL fold metallo-hydrolase [Psychroserpens ponticola]
MNYLKPLVVLICITVFSCKSDKKESNSNFNETIEKEEVSEVETINNESHKTEVGSEKKQEDIEKVITVTETSASSVTINPIFHGTLVLEYENVVLYIDPVGGAEAFKDQKPPSLILITDIHGDHLNIETLEAISTNGSKIIAPLAVADKLPSELRSKTSVLSNFLSKNYTIGKAKLSIEAIPMYNLREEALKFHPKNRGNGYVLTLGNERVYISGDTEDIPEMRQLKNIDIAFVCMNLPYTMTVESAADAVLEFKPKKVYPYHYRGTNGFSDVKKFKAIVNDKNSAIEVIQDEWYEKPDEV